MAVKGVRLTAGSKVLADNVPHEDAAVVELLQKAGAIIIGKTDTHEFAYGPYTPPTRNPWNLGRIPGGSSGGSGAALAAGMRLGALGTDTGGSIRIPAACCGVTGLKPTYGRVSCYASSVQLVARSRGADGSQRRGCANMFEPSQAMIPRSQQRLRPARQAAQFLLAAPGRGPLSLQGYGSAPSGSFVAPLDPEVRAPWQAALRVLKEEGAEIIEVELPRPTMHTYRTIEVPRPRSPT